MSRAHKPKLYPEAKRCGGKICYPSKHEAEQVKAEQELLNHVELSIYRCITCNKWHLTRNLDNRQSS